MAKKTSKDSFAALREYETNGENSDVGTSDIISWLKKWQKLSSFRISGVASDGFTMKFDTLPKNIKAFVRDAYKLCPDLVAMDEDVEIPALEKQVEKTRKLTFWWD